MNAIEVEHLSRAFDGVKAVDDISFRFQGVRYLGFWATTEQVKQLPSVC